MLLQIIFPSLLYFFNSSVRPLWRGFAVWLRCIQRRQQPRLPCHMTFFFFEFYFIESLFIFNCTAQCSFFFSNTRALSCCFLSFSHILSNKLAFILNLARQTATLELTHTTGILALYICIYMYVYIVLFIASIICSDDLGPPLGSANDFRLIKKARLPQLQLPFVLFFIFYFY